MRSYFPHVAQLIIYKTTTWTQLYLTLKPYQHCVQHLMVNEMSNMEVCSGIPFPFLPKMEAGPTLVLLGHPNVIHKTPPPVTQASCVLRRPKRMRNVFVHTHMPVSVCVGRFASNWMWEPQEGTDLAQRSTCPTYLAFLCCWADQVCGHREPEVSPRIEVSWPWLLIRCLLLHSHPINHSSHIHNHICRAPTSHPERVRGSDMNLNQTQTIKYSH